jgi:hypothetical protein
VDEPDRTPLFFGEDQPVGFEMLSAEDQLVEFIRAQGADDPSIGDTPIPELGQGGRVAVAKGSEADHRAFGDRGDLERTGTNTLDRRERATG